MHSDRAGAVAERIASTVGLCSVWEQPHGWNGAEPDLAGPIEQR